MFFHGIFLPWIRRAGAILFWPALADGSWIARSGVPGRAVGNMRQPNHLASLLLWARLRDGPALVLYSLWSMSTQHGLQYLGKWLGLGELGQWLQLADWLLHELARREIHSHTYIWSSTCKHSSFPLLPWL